MNKRVLLAALPLAFLIVFSLAPLARLLAEGRGAVSAGLLSDAYLQWRIGWSFLQAALTCLLCLLIGLPIAWSFARFDFFGKPWLWRLLMLPFVMPTLVAAMGVLALFGPQGVFGLNLQDTPVLLLYGNLFFNLPLMIRAVGEGLERLPPSRLLAARTLGASPWRVFWRVEWPALRPWAGSACCLIFLYCFSGFGLALLLGGQRYATVEVEIYQLVAYELNLADAGALALLMLAATGALMLLYAWLERRMAAPMKVERAVAQAPAGWRQRALLLASLALLLVFAGLPLLAVAARALAALGRLDWAVVWQEDTRLALWNTCRFTLAATALATALGILQGVAAKGSLGLRAAAFLPLLVSPVCVAFGLLLLYPALTASLGLLLAAYALLAWPFVARNLTQALESLPVSLPAAARTLGASPWRAFWRVSWPLALPALRRGAAFAAATALGEFAVTLFLSRPEWLTLTTLVYQRLGRPGQENADLAVVLSGVLMMLSLLAFCVIEWPGSRQDRRKPC
ncbi:ABC transporter permease subunit [uncultured Aquitalea sp.]|uniref:ABC transporter permease n=1 Tax=uncultured Aquitalea sp. TaxID=540272 RepID=UPI0025F2B413|nr:ABC transporter permease subunit [uncultured Aquitalea sp.]